MSIFLIVSRYSKKKIRFPIKAPDLTDHLFLPPGETRPVVDKAPRITGPKER